MEYLLKSSGIIALLYLFYYLFLRNETYFRSIRGYFLTGLLLVVTIPLIEIPIFIEQAANNTADFAYAEISTLNNSENSSIDWVQISGSFYIIGFQFFLFKFLIELISLGILITGHKRQKTAGFIFVETSKNHSPFSFFNIIVYNPKQFNKKEITQILTHEKAHALQWHSVDTLLAHLMVLILWFNPFVWLYKKAVQQNLEYLADSFAIIRSNNKKLYQLTMLKTCSTNYYTAIANNFYNSLIKKRIVMLHKNHSKNSNQWKYVLVLPLLIAFIATFNTKVIAQEKKLTEIKDVNNVKIDLIIDKNSTIENLKKEAALFKKEFDITLTFKGIKRNTSNEIIAIKIDAKGDKLRSKFENAGTNPIKPIKITYNHNKNLLSIGNVSKLHKNHYAYKIHESGDVEFKGKPDKDGNYVFVTSDGKTKTWTSKDGDSKKVEVKVVYESENGENVWISKDKNKEVHVEVIQLDEGKKKVKIIENGNELKFDNQIEVIEENDDENVFILKKSNIKKVETANDVSGYFIQDSKKPLVIIDGKKSTHKVLKKLDSDNIKEISILKGEKAIEKYGNKAKDGVILVTTKKN